MANFLRWTIVLSKMPMVMQHTSDPFRYLPALFRLVFNYFVKIMVTSLHGRFYPMGLLGLQWPRWPSIKAQRWWKLLFISQSWCRTTHLRSDSYTTSILKCTFRLTSLQALVLRKHAMPRFSIRHLMPSLHFALFHHSSPHHHFFKVIPTKDRIEALTAFREKRKPVFKGE